MSVAAAPIEVSFRDSDGASSSRMIRSISAKPALRSVAVSNGTAPISNSYKSTPSEYTSERLIDVSGHRVGLLRAGVLRRPDDLAELREQRVLYGPLVGGLRDAEIDHLGNRRAVLFRHQHIRRLQVAVDHTLLVRMLDRTADREEQRQPLPGGHPLAIAILGDGCALDVLHHEVRAPFGGRAGVEDLGDVRVVHHRQRLALVVEAGEHLAGVHAELHNFESHAPANGLALLGQVNGAHTPFA